MTDKCPNCGEILTKNERLRKYYCSSCGYQIKFDSIKVDAGFEFRNYRMRNDPWTSDI